ncbi:MAG: hypothetical protein JXA18_17650 [Chitinispirillaceae bacterium]|nr:hypothetical protein [Chitinispirillaceae bacterium]
MSRYLEKCMRVCFTGATIASAGFAASELPQVDGTTGAPLGGIGTGAVKFCGNNGKLYFADATPAKCANDEKSYVELSGNFAFYSSRGGTVSAKGRLVAASSGGRYDDDAVFPIQKANFGDMNGVNVRLIGSCPWEPLDSNKMTYPCALFQFEVANKQSSPVDVAIGFKITTGSNPSLVANKGFKDESSSSQKAVYAKSDNGAATVTIGSDADFSTSGQCGNAINGTSNMVAVKVTLPANATRKLQFVFAWYNRSNTSNYYYTNLFSGAGGVAEAALNDFDTFMTNAETYVTRMRSSNIPDWIVNTTMNMLCNLTNNSQYTKDGRLIYSEGKWHVHGTMDQMWHARQIISQLCPFFAWKELEFWARTQKKEASNIGQIHHDLGSCEDIAGRDETTWEDYRDIDHWVDVNCGFIISVYETFIATGDRAKLDWFWPYVLKAGQRLLTQLETYGNKTYPYTFENTAASSYDWNADDATHLYTSSLTIPTYGIMVKLATIKNDAANAARFAGAHDTAVVSFKKRFIDNIFPTAHYCEGISAGPWLSDFLKLGHDFSSGDIDKILTQLHSFYKPLTEGCGKNEGPDFGQNYYIWQMYLINHYADLSLIAGKKDIWYAMRHDNFQRSYQDRNRVFNITLGTYLTPTEKHAVATDYSGKENYITNPALFRDYYTIVGYQRNRHTGELWLEPNLPASMNDSLGNGFYISPEGDGTVSFVQNPTTFEQRIVFKPDNTIQVKQIYVKDKYGTTVPPVRVNGTRIADDKINRIGMGYGKELKINWDGTVTSSGLTVEVANSVSAVSKPFFQSVSDMVKVSGKQVLVRYAFEKPGPVSIVVYHLDGRKVTGGVFNQEAGVHEMVLNRTLPGFGNLSGSIYLLEVAARERKEVFKIILP